MIIDVEKSILSHPVLEEVGVKILVEPMREWNAGLSPVHLMGGRKSVSHKAFEKHVDLIAKQLKYKE